MAHTIVDREELGYDEVFLVQGRGRAKRSGHSNGFRFLQAFTGGWGEVRPLQPEQTLVRLPEELQDPASAYALVEDYARRQMSLRDNEESARDLHRT